MTTEVPPPKMGKHAKRCRYTDQWTDMVGLVPVCVVHEQNSKHPVTRYSRNTPCLEMDPWPHQWDKAMKDDSAHHTQREIKPCPDQACGATSEKACKYPGWIMCIHPKIKED